MSGRAAPIHRNLAQPIMNLVVDGSEDDQSKEIAAKRTVQKLASRRAN